MKRILISLLIALALVGCLEQKDPAEELYNQSQKYAQNREFDKAIKVCQNIRINYENSSFAVKAENDMSQYQDLIKMMSVNQERNIQTKFSKIHVALDNYKARFLSYPMTPKDLDKLPKVVVPEWDDIWGHPIHYTPTYSSPDSPSHAPDGYALASFGADGLPGGEGSNRDYFFKNGQIVPQVIE